MFYQLQVRETITINEMTYSRYEGKKIVAEFVRELLKDFSEIYVAKQNLGIKPEEAVALSLVENSDFSTKMTEIINAIPEEHKSVQNLKLLKAATVYNLSIKYRNDFVPQIDQAIDFLSFKPFPVSLRSIKDLKKGMCFKIVETRSHLDDDGNWNPDYGNWNPEGGMDYLMGMVFKYDGLTIKRQTEEDTVLSLEIGTLGKFGRRHWFIYDEMIDWEETNIMNRT